MVVGGGVAGIAAAVRLAQRGVAVTLVETRKRLGGRATSFMDPSTGELVDNCQHVLMGCCTNLIDLYRRLGVLDCIRWHRTLYLADRRGRIDALEADHLPAPLHLSKSMLAMKTLNGWEKFAVARGMLAILQMGDQGCRGLDHESFATWLAEQDQPAGAIDKFWAPIIVSACNERPGEVAACYALQVFQEGFLAHDQAYQMGVAAVPLVELYDAAGRVLAEAGGRVLLGTSAKGFEFDGHRVAGVRLGRGTRSSNGGGPARAATGERTLRAGAYIAAVPFDRLSKLSTQLMIASDPRLQGLEELNVSPIIGVHLYLRRGDGRPIMTLPHLALTQSPLQWVFNKGAHRPEAAGDAEPPEGAAGSGAAPPARDTEALYEAASADGRTVHLHGVISAAHDLVDRPADQLISMTVAELRKVLPGALGAQVVHARVVKEKRATFSVRPGIQHLRPTARGAIDNLLLAGDWCDTGWPATMEGAARSGYHAAGAALDVLAQGAKRSAGEGKAEDPSAGTQTPQATGASLVANDLPRGPLYRFMAG